jgi:protein phosphatase
MLHSLTRTPSWHTATAQGPRSVNADAVEAYADPNTQQVVFALADGVGDDRGAMRAARIAVSAAVRAAPGDGPVAALRAAQDAVRGDATAGDCVLVVALPFGSGYRIGWVGDVRAYAWNGDSLQQLTKDHTVAQYFRDRGQSVAPRMEHMVTTSVRTAGASEFGRAEVPGPVGLLLTSDGVHKSLALAEMAELLRQPQNSAAALTEAAISAGGSDNATAIFVEYAPPLPGHTAFTTAA